VAFKETILKHRRTSGFVALLALLTILVSLFHYISLPPAYLKSRVHVVRHYESFMSLVELFEQNGEIGQIRLEPDNIVHVSEMSDGIAIDWDAAELERVAGLLDETGALWVERRNESISFFGGEERKLGRYFQARVLYGEEWNAAIQHGKITSCLSRLIISKPKGECLDVIRPNLALHYLWVNEAN